LSSYADLQAAIGSDYPALARHFEKHGNAEGRRPSFFIEPVFYLNTYIDLQVAFGQNNFAAAHNHWKDNGIAEGRRGSSEFAVRNYIEKYPDLKTAFGENYAAAMHHFLEWGAHEGRNGL
jgi:hypothetical protein